MRKSAFLGYFLDCVNIAAVAIMLVVLFEMGRDTLTDWRPLVIAVVGAFATFGPKKINAMWIVASGAVLGFLLYLV